MLADRDPGSSPNVNAGGYVSLINADVEPTSKFKVKRVKPLSGGRLWIALKLPNEGILRVAGERIRLLSPGWKTLVVPAGGPALRISFTPIHGSQFTRVVSAR